MQDSPEELKRRILLHPGPYVKPRNLIRRLPRGAASRSTETIVAEMQSLQELGFGTLHSRGAIQKVFCKVSPDIGYLITMKLLKGKRMLSSLAGKIACFLEPKRMSSAGYIPRGTN